MRLLPLALAAACGGGPRAAERPAASLAATSEAQAELHPIVADFARGNRAARIALGPRLVAFRARFPREEVARTAEALLAWARLEEGRDDEATALAKEVLGGPAGNTASIARAVAGAAERRSGRPAEALATLSPLVSKVIDGWVRAFVNEEIVAAALSAGQFRRAVELMAVWLREAAPDERQDVEARLTQRLLQIPGSDLRVAFDQSLQEREGEAGSGAAPGSGSMRALMAQVLGRYALEHHDLGLAQHLLATAGPLLGALGDPLAQLAAGASRARVEERTVGLLLSLRTDETRLRGVEVAAGLAQGLELPGSVARLVSRDDGGNAANAEEALTALTADGSSVVIAGADEQEATVAARFAEANRIPVLLLRPPGPGAPPSAFTFVVGEDPARVAEALGAALVARGARPFAMVLSGAKASNEGVLTRDCADAVGAPWASLGLAGLVLGGSADCARDALIATAALRLHYAAGFEASAAALPPDSLVATAGLYPIDEAQPPEPLAPWLAKHALAPTWWAGLGHDAGVLAWAGIKALPAQGTEDPLEVRARRAGVAAALATADAELWTTDVRGFAGARVLPRTLGVREAGAPPAGRRTATAAPRKSRAKR